MEEIIISPIIESLIGRLKSAAGKEIKFTLGVDNEVTRLLKSFSYIQSVVVDAEEKQFASDKVKQWLLRLKSVVSDAEDVSEEFISSAAEAKEEGPESGNAKEVKNPCPCFHHSETPTSETREKFRRLRRKVSRIEKECRRLRLIEAHKPEVHNTMPEHLQEKVIKFVALDTTILGRGEDKRKLAEELLSSKFSGKGPSVISIVAPDGMGKTTFARHVYNSKEIKERFEIRWWFRASPDLDEEKINGIIFTDRLGFVYDGSTETKVRVKEFLRTRRFLFVFDNVRDDNPNWKMLLKPLAGRHEHSKIIITTKSEEVASALGTDAPFRLEGLSREDCAKLFNMKVFQAEGLERSPNLKQIGERIVDKCGGCPLAVKALGGFLLDRRDETEWQNVLESPIWNENNNSGAAFRALQICYQNFPASSKLCFRYFSLFPRDYWYLEDELLKLWTAEGYTQNDKVVNVVNDMMFQSFMSIDYEWPGKRFGLHDIAQDLAEAMSGKEFVRIEEGNNPSVIPQGVRHSSFVWYTEWPKVNFQELCKDTNKDSLRTFLYLDMSHYEGRLRDDYEGDFGDEQLDLLLQCKFLRVLMLLDSVIERRLESILELKLLRYLNLSDAAFRKLRLRLEAL